MPEKAKQNKTNKTTGSLAISGKNFIPVSEVDPGLKLDMKLISDTWVQSRNPGTSKFCKDWKNLPQRRLPKFEISSKNTHQKFWIITVGGFDSRLFGSETFWNLYPMRKFPLLNHPLCTWEPLKSQVCQFQRISSNTSRGESPNILEKPVLLSSSVY